MMNTQSERSPKDKTPDPPREESPSPASRESFLSIALMSASVAATSVFLLALFEIPNIPRTAYAARPLLYGTGTLRVIQEILRYCWVNAFCVFVVFASLRIPSLKGWVGLLLRAFALWAALGYNYWILSLYEPFAGYPPVVGGLGILLFASTLALHFLHTRTLTPPSGTTGRRGVIYHRLGTALSFLAFLAALLISRGNYQFYKGLYPTLHLSALLLTHLFLGLAVVALVQAWPVRTKHLRSAASRFGWFALGLSVLALALLPTKVLESARPHVTACTMAGQAQAVFHRFESAREEDRPRLPTDKEAEARFVRQSGLPLLEENYLKGKNVLLVTWEATRFDHTDLSDAGGTHTPHMKKFFLEEKAYSFTRAYSPSSGTLHSISSVLAMSYPSSIELETWKKSWHGELFSDGNLVPEVFARSGYHTFRISHSYRGCFRHGILGFHHGFDHQELISEKKLLISPHIDRDIVSAALGHLRKVGNTGKPFFGWVFLGGPHFPYQAHYDDIPKVTEHDRYIHELRNSDEEMGRLLGGIKEMGLLKDTIVVFFGDHGEEFGEHGGAHHKSTVYTESTHVPMLIYLPGKTGEKLHKPVSTYYTFPWLLRTGPRVMRDVAERRIREDIGPMMRATDGAVLIELIGHDRMMASLVYDKEKFNYDFLSTLYQAFNLEEDPYEQKDLFDTHPEMAERGVQRMSRYLTVRAARAKYILKPEDTR